MRRNRKQSGMTLLELSLAGVLVSVALIGTTASLFSSVSLHETISRKRGATRSVSSLLEDVRATDFVDLATEFSDSNHVVHDGGGRDGTARVTVREVDSTTSRWRVHEVRIDVTFPDGELDDGLTFVTYVSDRTEGGGVSRVPVRSADVSNEEGTLLDLIAEAETELSKGQEKKVESTFESQVEALEGDGSSLSESDLLQLYMEMLSAYY